MVYLSQTLKTKIKILTDRKQDIFTCREVILQIMGDFSSERKEARKQWDNIL